MSTSKAAPDLSRKASIIIAAFNEAKVIKNTLEKLCRRDALDAYNVIVVCNGCTDNTEVIVRNNFPKVTCHSLPYASKARAIHYAESLNPGFPRLYLDADISLTATDASSLIDKSNQNANPHLIIPRSQIDTSKSSSLVKCFYRAWYQTPYVKKLGFGAGTYLINQAGRKRFEEWPELMADDGFIRSQFCVSEILIAEQQYVSVKTPKSIWSLIRTKTRSKLGNLELRSYLNQHSTGSNFLKLTPLSDAQRLPFDQINWYDWIVYYSVNVVAMVYAKWHHITKQKHWYTDQSSRS